MNESNRIHIGRLQAYIESHGITNELDALISAIEQDDEHDLQADDEYEETALHSNREWIMSVLTAASKAIDINYHIWCVQERQERLELLIEELEGMK